MTVELEAETVLARYVPRVVREWLHGPHPDAAHQRVDGSMVFVDISGFTKMSERLSRLGKMGAEEVTDVIAGCFSQLLSEAYAFDGTLLKFGGDALLLFFRDDGHARRSAAAALEMRRTLRRIRVFETGAGRVELGMTVGVHTGSFDFFLVGGSHRELVIVGPSASELVALEGSATTGRILVSDTCAEQLPATNVGPARGEGRLLRGRVQAPRSQVRFFEVDHDLARFVPRAMTEAIRGQSSLESEHRSVTVAFLHFEGIDHRIRTGDIDGVARDLDDLVRTVQEAVDHRDLCFLSTDIAPDGGKIILTAGAPRGTGHDEEAMLLAVRAVLDAGTAIPLRVGINAGPVFAGEIGTIHRTNYTIMGDPVNLAARVMGKAVPGQALATAPVIDQSRTLFDSQALEPFMVKGKKDPVTAFSVGEARGTRVEVATTELPLTGRDRELQLLDDAANGARQRSGRAIEIVADTGSGKSRLLTEYLHRCEDFAVHTAGCRLYQADTPYFPIGQLLEEALGLAGLGALETAARLGEVVAEDAPHLLPWLSLLGVPLGVDIEPSEEVEHLDDEFRKARLEASVVELLECLLTSPTVLVVEDAHWMDDASADLIQTLLARVGRLPWVFIDTRRALGGPQLDPNGSSLVRIELAPLDPASAIELVEAATRDDPLPKHVAEGLVARADGNPLFLLELLNAVRTEGDLESLPTSVEALITARIDRLPGTERNHLRRVSVLGAGFSLEHFGSLLDDSPQGVVQRLEDFLSVDASGWVSFRHALVRDVAYEGLPYRTRRKLHSQVADSILSELGGEPGDQVALLSLHMFHAHRHAEAWELSIEAGDRARDVYANLDAAALYDRALLAARRLESVDTCGRAMVHESLGDVQNLAGLYNDARRSYAAARKLYRDRPVHHAGVILKEAYVAEHEGRYPDAIRCVRRGLKTLASVPGPEGDVLRARLTVWEAAVRAMQGRFADALERAELGIAHSMKADDERTLARAYQIIDFSRMNLGISESLDDSYRALEIYSELGDLAGEATAANNLGAHSFYEGEWERAADLYRRALAANERIGDPVNGAGCSMNLAELLLEQGEIDQAVNLLREARATYQSAGDQWGVAFTSRLLGVAKARSGALEDASDLLLSAQQLFSSIGSKAEALDTNAGMAERLLFAEQPADALAHLDLLLDHDGVDGGHEPQLPAVHRLRGFAFAQLGDLDAAMKELWTSLRLARDLGAQHEVGLTLDAFARLNDVAGIETPVADVAERREIFDRLGVRQRVTPPLPQFTAT